MRREVPGTEDSEPDLRPGSYAFCRMRSSSSDMMSLASCSCSLPRIDGGSAGDMGETNECGVWRIEGSGVGRCIPPDDVENCDVFEVERVCRWRPFTGVKVTSDIDLE